MIACFVLFFFCEINYKLESSCSDRTQRNSSVSHCQWKLFSVHIKKGNKPTKKLSNWKILSDYFCLFYLAADCNAVLKALQPVFQEQGMTETVHNWEDHGYLATYIKKNGRWVDFPFYFPSVYTYKYFSSSIRCYRVQVEEASFTSFACEITLKWCRILLRTLCQLLTWLSEQLNWSNVCLCRVPCTISRWFLLISE